MKISDYPSATATDNADILYVIQTSGTAKISKKIAKSLLLSKVDVKTIFNKGINYGTAPQSLTNTGTVDIQSGIAALNCTADSSFILPSGTQGDEILILVETNPSFICEVVGTFAHTSSIDIGLAGQTIRIVFHHGKWYVVGEKK